MTALQTTSRNRLESASPTECPICGRDHDRDTPEELDSLACSAPATDGDATHHAAHCCLWHQFDHASRTRIAQRVEAGSNWAEAIEGEPNA